jgi:hypothetical protein
MGQFASEWKGGNMVSLFQKKNVIFQFFFLNVWGVRGVLGRFGAFWDIKKVKIFILKNLQRSE